MILILWLREKCGIQEILKTFKLVSTFPSISEASLYCFVSNSQHNNLQKRRTSLSPLLFLYHFMLLSIYSSILLCFYLSLYIFFYPSIILYFFPSYLLSFYACILLSMLLPSMILYVFILHPFMLPSIYLSILQSFCVLFLRVYPSICILNSSFILLCFFPACTLYLYTKIGTFCDISQTMRSLKLHLFTFITYAENE